MQRLKKEGPLAFILYIFGTPFFFSQIWAILGHFEPARASVWSFASFVILGQLRVILGGHFGSFRSCGTF